MNYQVCWTYENQEILKQTCLWFANFFDKKEDALEFYRDKKRSTVVRQIKILTIKGGKCLAQKKAE